MATTFVLGCDQGKQHDTRTVGPYIQLQGMNFGPGTPIRQDGVIQLTLSRLLDPVTVVRQSVVIRTKSGNLAAEPVVTYDPVALTVTLSNPAAADGGSLDWLTDPFYDVVLGIPSPGATSGGFRALDGQTLDPSKPLLFELATTAPPATTDAGAGAGDAQADAGAGDAQAGAETGAQAAGTSFPPPRLSFCDDILPLFQNSCTSGACHAPPQPDGTFPPATGLVLSTALGIQQTARGRAAEGANTGGRASAASEGTAFGVNMPIIDADGVSAGSPGNSWLMYKLLLATPTVLGPGMVDVQGSCNVAPTDVGFASVASLSATERAVLSNYILGQEMPYPPVPGGATNSAALTMNQLERIRIWIAQGASVPPDYCTTCSTP